VVGGSLLLSVPCNLTINTVGNGGVVVYNRTDYLDKVVIDSGQTEIIPRLTNDKLRICYDGKSFVESVYVNGVLQVEVEYLFLDLTLTGDTNVTVNFRPCYNIIVNVNVIQGQGTLVHTEIGTKYGYPKVCFTPKPLNELWRCSAWSINGVTVPVTYNMATHALTSDLTYNINLTFVPVAPVTPPVVPDHTHLYMVAVKDGKASMCKPFAVSGGVASRQEPYVVRPSTVTKVQKDIYYPKGTLFSGLLGGKERSDLYLVLDPISADNTTLHYNHASNSNQVMGWYTDPDIVIKVKILFFMQDGIYFTKFTDLEEELSLDIEDAMPFNPKCGTININVIESHRNAPLDGTWSDFYNRIFYDLNGFCFEIINQTDLEVDLAYWLTATSYADRTIDYPRAMLMNKVGSVNVYPKYLYLEASKIFNYT